MEYVYKSCSPIGMDALALTSKRCGMTRTNKRAVSLLPAANSPSGDILPVAGAFIRAIMPVSVAGAVHRFVSTSDLPPLLELPPA